MDTQVGDAIPPQNLNGGALKGGQPDTPQPLPTPDPRGGGRMSRRVYALTIALLVLTAFVLTYALDSNRTPPEPTHSEGSEGSSPNMNWPEAKTERVTMPPPAVGAVATAMPATAVNQFSAQQTNRIAMRPPDPLSEWRRGAYLSALQAPIRIGAAHAGDTLNIARQEAAAQPPALTDQAFPTQNYGGGAAQYHPPAPPYSMMAGTVIPAVLITGITSDASAQVLAQVAQNVYDTATGRYLLIPQGARVLGDYSTSVHYGQSRIAINWRRVVLPNTASIDLPSVPATDAAGYGGLADQINNHYLRTFGTAALISLIDAGQMVGQLGMSGGSYGVGAPYGAYGSGINSTEMIGMLGGSTASQQLGQVAQNNLQAGMNIPPTISIRPGFRLNIELTTDVTLPGAYQP
jgi:type IV secretory pathway VirB10-like protein